MSMTDVSNDAMNNAPERKPVKWSKVTEDKYWEMLEVLPPAVMTGLGFLVGEPLTHGACPVTGKFGALYEAFAKVGKDYYVASEAMTVGGFKTLTPKSVTGGRA